MMNLLAINSGSSSLKFKVVEFDESQKPDARFTMSSRYAGFVEEIGPAAKLMLRLDGKIVVQSTSIVSTHAEAVQHMIQMLEKSSRLEGRDFRVDAVGHRVPPECATIGLFHCYQGRIRPKHGDGGR